MFGLTHQEAEAVQADPILAVEKLVVRQLRGMAATGKRIVLLVDALDEAQERGTNRVVRLLKDLGQAKTNALSVVVVGDSIAFFSPQFWPKIGGAPPPFALRRGRAPSFTKSWIRHWFLHTPIYSFGQSGRTPNGLQILLQIDHEPI